MTSSNGNSFRVTGPLCGEFTGPDEFPTQRPVTRSFDVFFDLRLNKWLSKQPWGWWFETTLWSLWRQCNGPQQKIWTWSHMNNLFGLQFSRSLLKFRHRCVTTPRKTMGCIDISISWYWINCVSLWGPGWKFPSVIYSMISQIRWNGAVRKYENLFQGPKSIIKTVNIFWSNHTTWFESWFALGIGNPLGKKIRDFHVANNIMKHAKIALVAIGTIFRYQVLSWKYTKD